MSTVTTQFDAVLDGTQQYYRPLLPCSIPGLDNDAGFSTIWYATDILATDQAEQNGLYNYATQVLTPTVSGNYTITVDAAQGLLAPGGRSDTQIWLYDTTFDPEDPLVNVIAANEDIDFEDEDGEPAIWLSHLPNMALVAGHTYVLVVTTYSPDATGFANFSATGPGDLMLGDLPSDTTPPVMESVGVPPVGTYGAGEHLDFTVTFNETVLLETSAGWPTLGIAIGGQTVQAAYASGAGTDTLTFRYTLLPGQEDTDGIAVTGLMLHGSFIHDLGYNEADITLQDVGDTSGVLVGSAAPAIVAVAVPAAGTYGQGGQLNFRVTLDEAVIVDTSGGTPRIALNIGGQTVHAHYVSGSGTTSLVFQHTLAGGMTDNDGVTIGALSANGGTLRDAAGNDAALALHGVASTAGVLVDSLAPAVVAVAVPAAGTYAMGGQLQFTVTFDDAVTVGTGGGTPRIALDVGGQVLYANYVSGSGTTALVFQHTLATNRSDTDGITIGSLQANGATLKDATGNNAALALQGVASTAGVLVDSAPPSIFGNIGVPAAGSYRAGETLTFNVVFDDNVIITGTDSTLGLTIGSTGRFATFASKTQNSITYTYTVQAGDNDTNGIAVTSLNAGTSTIRDAVGNDASLTLFRHVPSTTNILVDTRAPAVTAVAVPPNGAHAAGTVLDFTVTFDENVTVTGTDGTLALTIGATARTATFLSSGARTVTYRYTVQAGDNDADGIAVGAINLGAGAIRDAAGNNAALSLAGRVPPTAGIMVDTQAPSVTSVTVPPDGTHKAGTVLDFSVTFDEAIIVTGTDGTLALTIGGIGRNATFLSSSGNTITYRYTVQAGDNDGDGITVGAIGLGTGTIRDAAGTNAALSLAGYVPSTAGIMVDTRAPAVASVTVPQDGTHTAGAALDFTVAFDEAVTVTGTDGTLALTVGGTVREATFLSSTGTTITYRYTVQAGDNDADGITVGAINTGSGAIRDAAGNDAALSLAGQVPPTTGVVVDARAPAVTGVSVPQGGSHGAGAQLDFTVTFDEAVTVNGMDGTLALAIGGAARNATFLSASGNTVTYRYTVQAGDNDADGITVGALALGTSTIRDAAGNDAALSLAGQVPPTDGIVVDTQAPAVAGMTVPLGGIHGVGTQLDFTVAFDEAVVVTGTDGTLSLTIGGSARNATFLSSTGDTVTYRYTVQAGDSDADGITVGAIGLGAGAIRDAAGNDAALSLAGHVPPTSGIVLDARAPEVTGMTVPADGAHAAGAVLDFTVAFDEAVTVTGTDGTLALTIGGMGRSATFLSSTGNTVTYRYTVQAGDNDADGITVGALALGTSTIRDAAGNDAALSLAGHVPSTAGISVDTQAPAVAGMTIPADGLRAAGAVLDFTVAFDEAVTVTGTDGTLALTIGGTARSATFLSSTGNTVTYRYTVQAGDNDVDGIAIGAIDPGAGTIRDAAGNDAALSLAGHVPPTGGIVVDAQAPAVAGMTIPADGVRAAGAVLDFTVAFDEAVTVTGTDGSLALTIGGIGRSAAFLSSTGNTITYRYTVQAGDNDADGIAVGAIDPGTGTIRDAAGNDAALSLAGHVPPTAGIVVDTQAPVVTSVTVPPDGTHKAGTVLDFSVTFDEAVTISGTDGTLALAIGGIGRNAAFLSSTGNTVTYRYTVQAGDNDADGITIGALALGTGTIKDAAGNDAALSLTGLVPSTAGIVVDTQAPAVAGMTVPQNGTLSAGAVLDFTVAFDEAVLVTGTDGALALTIGGTAREATFLSSTGNIVTYRYAVQAGDSDADGIAIGAIDVGTGAIRDAAGNDAALSLAGHVPPTGGIVVDARAPEVTGITVPADGASAAGAVLDFTVAFDEAVTVTGTDGSLALTIGGIGRSAAFLSSTGNTVTYRYTVQAGDNDADGIAIGAISLGAGAIRDAAGNDAALSLAGHVPSTAGITVDTRAPAVAGVTVPPDGTHKAGTVLDFTVAFDEAVTVTGTDGTLALAIGGTARSATFLSSTGNTVTYRYTVQAGDNDADGIAIGAIDPGTGTIRDAAGNDAALSLAGNVPPTGGIVVDTRAPAVAGMTVPPGGSHGAGTALDFTVAFDEAVTVTGTDGTLALTVGGTARSAAFLSSTGNTVTYRYTVQAGDSDADGIAIGAISLGAGTIRDAAGNDAALSLAGHVPPTGGIVVDAQAPAVTGVAVPQDGVHDAGTQLDFTVTFDDAVTVTGTEGSLALTIGGIGRSAAFLSSTGNTVTYRYTVQAGDNDADGIAIGAISLGAGAIRDAAGNDAVLSLAGLVPPTAGITVDTRAPAVAGVMVPPDGTHKAGTVLDFTVAFDEAVTVTGTDGTLALTIGGIGRSAAFVSASGNAITYRYTVQAGDNDADGIAVGAIGLGAGTIRDAAGNDAALSLAGRVPLTGGIRVDTQPPAVTDVSVPLSGVHGAGDHLDFTVSFDEAVTVTGTDGTLALTIGGIGRSATFLSSTGSTVTYRYTVQAGDNDADGITVGALALGTSTIRDAAGNDASLLLAGHLPGTGGIRIDADAPAVAGFIGVPAPGTYAAGDTLVFSVTFDSSVTVQGGISVLGLVIGGAAREAVLVSSAGPVLTYAYTVLPGDIDADGIAVGGIALNGSTIRDAAGNDAALALGGHVPPLGAVLVDAQAPSVTGVAAPAAGTYAAGDTLAFTITFDDNVAVTGTDSTLTVNVGGVNRAAAFASSNGNSVTYTYTVQAGENDGDGIAIGALSLGTSTIHDAAGNDAALSLAGRLPPTGAILVDTQAPVVTGVAVPGNGVYGTGMHLDFTVAFSEAVTISSTDGTLYLVVGGTLRTATFLSSGSNVITYRYTVQSGDADADGISVFGISLNGSTITDAAGNDAVLVLAGHVPSLGGVRVDTTVPGPIDTQAPSVTHVGTSADGTYAAGEQLEFTVIFNESVIVTGADSALGLTIGGAARSATFLSSSANAVTYRYTVQAGDNDADGITIGALALGTSTIRDAAGNDAALSLAGHLPPTGAILVDTQAPVVTGVAVPGNGVYSTGMHLDFTVTFSEVVDVAGAGSTLGLAIGGAVHNAQFLSSTGNTITYRYTVQPGDADADGISVVGITLDGGTVTDAAGNDATLALAGQVPPLDGVLVQGSLPDTTAPVFINASVNGRTLVLSYDEAGLLDAVHGPAAGAFTVMVAGVARAVSVVAVDADARTVTLTLATAVRHDQPVTVAYADPTAGNDAAAIQDVAGNDAAPLAATPVMNTTPPILTPPPVDPPPVDPPPVDPPPFGDATIDGLVVRTVTETQADGSVTQVMTIPVVTASRVEQVGAVDMADIPLVTNAAGTSLLTAQLPIGYGLQASGATQPTTVDASSTDLIREIRAHTANGSADQAQLTGAGTSFIGTLDDGGALLVQTIVPIAAGDAVPGRLIITGAPAAAGHVPTALVIDARGLPPGTSIELNDVEFAAVVGAVRIVNGAGAQIVFGDGAAQEIMLGEGDDVLHGGAGNDIVGSAAGNDRVFGDEGDDIVFGGEHDDMVDGGSGNDIVQLAGAGRSDYSLRVVDGNLVMAHRDGGIDGTDVVSNVETLRFLRADTSTAGTVGRLVEALTGDPASVATVDALVVMAGQGAGLSHIAHILYGQAGPDALDDTAFVGLLYRNVFGREVDSVGDAYWPGQLAGGAARADVALLIADSAEKLAMPTDVHFGDTDVGTLVRLYSTLYDRAPDEGGLNFWIAAHESGLAMASIADAFVADVEGRSQYGGLGDADFVTALYHAGMHREPGAEEVQYWTGLLGEGHADRGDVLLAFADSAEKVALVGTMSSTFDLV
ncbi:DUF4214 domain-containing protein [Pseudoduganella lutea]|uniref:DUF4214 domain-containing protein n=1 Tax=Pseudoduganella lutea TaxID=321985 RepID=A0A4P6L153_9BURK|nr:DUF4214 domain-containing protein [Pseudoduganella lutea]QBE65236.1 DUF4214 domain-containing protein [Pseudoduganella lutea]